MQGEAISGPSNMRILVFFDQSKCFIVLVELVGCLADDEQLITLSDLAVFALACSLFLFISFIFLLSLCDRLRRLCASSVPPKRAFQ